MATFYDIDAANARLPEVQVILEHLRRRRTELIALRDLVVAHRRAQPSLDDGGDRATTGPGDRGVVPGAGDPGTAPNEIDVDSPRILDARIRAVIDQMEAGVAQLDAWDIHLRDIGDGLIDFPALANGRQVWLCWRLDEPAEIHFWHELDSGYAGRRPLIELT